MDDIMDSYRLWLSNANEDPDLIYELRSIEGHREEISDRFYTSLSFGTAGLRGVIGAGTNRMNIYTVAQATQGLANMLNKQFEKPSVAIAYDSRIKSKEFAMKAAGVLAANGVKAYIFKELVPTPVLSFAVRELKCQSGIIITASHNPSKYNGFKCYDANGYQMTDESAAKTLEEIRRTDIFKDVKSIDPLQGIENGTVEFIGDELVDKFLDMVKTQCVNPGICEKSNLCIIYTPLNGTGNKPVRKILKKIGVENVTVVPEQENPDGNFPTCPFPNPEIEQAFEYAMKLTDKIDADLLLATDPDCDRVGIAVKADDGSYKLMSGNEVGVMLLDYILSQKQSRGELPKNPVAVKSFVSTNLAKSVAEKYGCKMKTVLTGFKYIGEFITELEDKGEADRFILGFEESYGYLCGTHARDKDAVVASMMIAEMAAYYKNSGKTLIDVMNEIYNEFGIYRHKIVNMVFEGESGMEKMRAIMERLRTETPESVGGFKVVRYSDYQTRETVVTADGSREKILLPKTNALVYELENGNGLIVRPSGTEPKIKAYVTARASTQEEAEIISENITADFKKLIGG